MTERIEIKITNIPNGTDIALNMVDETGSYTKFKGYVFTGELRLSFPKNKTGEVVLLHRDRIPMNVTFFSESDIEIDADQMGALKF